MRIVSVTFSSAASDVECFAIPTASRSARHDRAATAPGAGGRATRVRVAMFGQLQAADKCQPLTAFLHTVLNRFPDMLCAAVNPCARASEPYMRRGTARSAPSR